MAAPRPTLDHYWGDKLTHLVLIIVFSSMFNSKVTRSLVTSPLFGPAPFLPYVLIQVWKLWHLTPHSLTLNRLMSERFPIFVTKCHVLCINTGKLIYNSYLEIWFNCHVTFDLGILRLRFQKADQTRTIKTRLHRLYEI